MAEHEAGGCAAYAFWSQRWSEGRIGFHEGKPNELLVAHAGRLEERPGLRVLVPLCGKAVDLAWLAARGHEVVGVEFHEPAVRAFFAERGVEAAQTRRGRHRAFAAPGVTVVCADFFEVGPADVGTFDLVYDRAALIALEPGARRAYVETCRALRAPGGRSFVITVAYDQARVEGPPWSVDEATVRALFAPAPVEAVDARTVTPAERLAAAGVETLVETAFLVG